MRKEFVYRKKLELYKAYYEKVSDSRTLLYSAVGDEEHYVSKEYASNFLLALRMFKKVVPRRVIRERFEDFRDAKDLAVEVLE